MSTKTAVVNSTGSSQPLVAPYRMPGIVYPAPQRLTVRDLCTAIPVTSNLIQYARETSANNAAAPQTGGSPNSGENVAKAESGLTFDLKSAPVETVAHWLPASRQLMEDSAAFSAYINARMSYFLKLKEELQLLTGDGLNNNLSGLITNATHFDSSMYISATDTYIDVLGEAITQAELSNLEVDGVILNKKDWSRIERIKTTGTALNGEYIFSDPHHMTAPAIWGRPVVPTVSMPEGEFLVGGFKMGATIWDRMDATVEVSREHADFFIKNMVAILCEERLALTIHRPEALVYGHFPTGS